MTVRKTDRERESLGTGEREMKNGKFAKVESGGYEKGIKRRKTLK